MKSFLILIVLAAIVGYLAAVNIESANKTTVSIGYYASPQQNVSPSYVTILVPAVDESGKGVITNLTVEAKPGNGKVLVDINNLFFWVDTQNSIRVAGKVAESASGLKINNYDIVYSIITNASAVEGPSAGAALTLATIAALHGKQVKKDVMITGTINSDGSIGQVGEIFSKAKAAKEFNATLFLVPAGQSIDLKRTYEKICKKYLLSEFCSTEWKTTKINVSDAAGINVVEVKDIYEAMKHAIE